jgi:hypothetical protein
MTARATCTAPIQDVGKPGNPPASEAGDRRFESDHPDSIDRDVLLGEQCGSNPHAEGSTPSVLAACNGWVAQQAEQ